MATTPLFEELTDDEKSSLTNSFHCWPLNDLVRFTPDNLLMPRTFVDLHQRVLDFPVREGDVWICSYPKSGTTWTQEMVWQIANNMDKEGGKEPLYKRAPFLECGCIFPPEASCELDKLGDAIRDPPTYLKTVEGTRVIKTHLPFNFLPPNLLDKAKVIYVARNVKDVSVSYYHHNVNIQAHDFQGNFEEFVPFFEKGLLFYGSYISHVLQGWKQRNHKNVKMIWFEDMKKDQRGVLEEVCEFLEMPLEEDKVEELVEHLKFENMKKNPAVNEEDAGFKGDFIRKGKVGDWRNYFNEEREEIWNKRIDEQVKDQESILGNRLKGKNLD